MPNVLECLETDKTLDLPSQIFGVTTYDALFKWVFRADEVRPSFFSACIPELHIHSSTILDEHMNPLKTLENLRHFMDGQEQKAVAKQLMAKKKEIEVSFSGEPYKPGAKFLKDVVLHFEDMRKAFPKAHYDGTLDFLCDLDTGELALVEMQITPEDHWDRRALAYIASAYSHQMRKGMVWKDIRTVIGINILGGGLNDEKHWKETPGQYMRHYKLQEQVNGELPPRFLEGVQVIQYSLANVPFDEVSPERKEWLIFFRNAHKMTEMEVKQTIRTPAVLAAFERAKLSNLPEEVMSSYKEEEARLKNLSGHIAQTREEGVKEGIEKGKEEGIKEGIEKGIEKGKEKGKEEARREMAHNLLKNGVEISIIAAATNLSREEISSLLP